MNIAVMNGSPKGAYSITYQTVLYLEKVFSEHTFEVVHIGQKIRTLEKDLTEVIECVKKADLILFSYPVYTFIAPSQLHRLFELLKEQQVDLSGKFATQITTSKHFYDITAHRYVQDNVQDLNMKYIRGLSADMDDLPTDKGQKEAKSFFEYVLWSMKNNVFEPIPIKTESKTLCPIPELEEVEHTSQKDVVIVTDANNKQIESMIREFRKMLPAQSRVVNLHDLRMDGGCLGCFNCAVDGKCIYKDKFDENLRNNIQKADAIIYAYTIKDHSMGALFKKYDDRQFCNGHRTVTMGLPIGYIVSGELSKEENLRTIMEARSEVGGNFHVGVASDEVDPKTSLEQFTNKLMYAMDHKLTQPANFYGVGGMKIFRDLIYLMQGMMKADHKFYKEHGQYDFPQKKKGTLIGMYFVGWMLGNPKIKAKLGNNMNEGMLLPYKKLFDKMDAKKKVIS